MPHVGDRSKKLPNMWEGMVHVGISEGWISEHRHEGKKGERRGNQWVCEESIFTSGRDIGNKRILHSGAVSSHQKET